MKIPREKLIIVLSAAIVAVVTGIYLFLYMPLVKRLRTNLIECRTCENEVRDARNLIEMAGEFYTERVLITEEGISQAIDELTSRGKSEGINFISINPGEVKKMKDLQYEILPIQMEIESTYEQLGVFLGSLDDLNKGIFKVKGFSIVSSEKDPQRLITDLVVDLYLG